MRALEGVTLEARSEEFLCVVGPSGCGKSTLLRIIAGLVSPTAGDVVFNGHGPGEAACGLVFQEHGTFPWMTVLENVALGLEFQGVPRRERTERAMAFVERVGLEAFADCYPHQLSVGMRQRVGIARAFVSGSSILLMDEPFGALDPLNKWVLQEELLRIWREDRKVVVYVTHDISEAALLGDRILVMTGRPGRVRRELANPLPRPRDPIHDRQAVHALTEQVWELLEAEVRHGLAVSS